MSLLNYYLFCRKCQIVETLHTYKEGLCLDLSDYCIMVIIFFVIFSICYNIHQVLKVLQFLLFCALAS